MPIRLPKEPGRWRKVSHKHADLLAHYGQMDGNTWVADRNSGQKPRVVIDIRVPLKYKPQAEVFEKFLRQN